MSNILEEQQGKVQPVSEAPAITPHNMANAGISIDIIALLSMSKLFGVKQNISTVDDYDIKEDFDWYSSGEPNTEPYKGQYIAIWKKNIVANAPSASEVKKIAKSICGRNCRPAIIYVPEEKDAIL